MEKGLPSIGLSPTASPSGDLVAAFSSERGDVDISLFDAKNRRWLRNLTKGFSHDYQYLVGQWLTTGPEMGRDIAFSPDGNTLAVFGKRERGRSLLLIDVLKGGVRKILPLDEVDQELAPAWSPDGTKIAFAANQNGRFDIFIVDVADRAADAGDPGRPLRRRAGVHPRRASRWSSARSWATATPSCSASTSPIPASATS